MKLIVVESPTKARTITKFLGKNPAYEVIASIGHIRDLPKSNKNAIDVDAGFIPHYVIPAGKEAVVKDLIARAEKADEILLATDPDREGEAIAWHISEIIKDANKKGNKYPQMKRVLFHEITQEAIDEALLHAPRARSASCP